MKIRKGEIAILNTNRLVKFAFNYSNTTQYNYLKVLIWEQHPVLVNSADSGWGWSDFVYPIAPQQIEDVFTNEVADIWRKANGKQ